MHRHANAAHPQNRRTIAKRVGERPISLGYGPIAVVSAGIRPLRLREQAVEGDDGGATALQILEEIRHDITRPRPMPHAFKAPVVDSDNDDLRRPCLNLGVLLQDIEAPEPDALDESRIEKPH